MRLLVLGAQETGVLAAARARGLFLIAVDRDAGAPGFRLAHRRAILPLDDEPALERLVEAGHVDAVLGTDSPTIAVAARIASRFGLRHPLSPEAALLASSTLRRRTRLAEARVPQTRWAILRGHGPAPFPAVVRPADRKGRRVAEEAPGAAEVTVTAFSRGGTFEPLLGSGAPAELARRAVQALGIREGVTSTRLRLGVDGPRVASLRAHVGAREAELCRLLRGIDVHGLALDAALGLSPLAEDVRFGSADAQVA